MFHLKTWWMMIMFRLLLETLSDPSEFVQFFFAVCRSFLRRRDLLRPWNDFPLNTFLTQVAIWICINLKSPKQTPAFPGTPTKKDFFQTTKRTIFFFSVVVTRRLLGQGMILLIKNSGKSSWQCWDGDFRMIFSPRWPQISSTNCYTQKIRAALGDFFLNRSWI